MDKAGRSGPALYLLLAEGNGAISTCLVSLVSEFTCVLWRRIPLCPSRADHQSRMRHWFCSSLPAKFVPVGRGKVGLGTARSSSGMCWDAPAALVQGGVTQSSVCLSVPRRFPVLVLSVKSRKHWGCIAWQTWNVGLGCCAMRGQHILPSTV